jgi:hypothetical protein
MTAAARQPAPERLIAIRIQVGEPLGIHRGFDLGLRIYDAGLKLVHFGAQLVELGLAGDVVKAAAELIGHGARAAGPLARGAHETRQILRTHHDERNHDDNEKLGPGDVEHTLLSLSHPAGSHLPDRTQRTRPSRALRLPLAWTEAVRDRDRGTRQPCLTSSAFLASAACLSWMTLVVQIAEAFMKFQIWRGRPSDPKSYAARQARPP